LSEMLGAIAGIVGTVLSIFALKTARDANATSKATSEGIAARESERDQRLLAGRLQAWWAIQKGDGPNIWGVMISNESSLASLFHDVQISTVSNNVPGEISIKTLPPGRFFVGRDFAKNHPWSLPLPLAEGDVYEPVTSSENHSITRLAFTDQLGTKWAWTPQESLRKLR